MAKLITFGDRNTFNGYQSGYSNAAHTYGGNDHTFIGYKAGYTSGTNDAEGICNRNTFIGSTSGFSNTIGYRNTFWGMPLDIPIQ